MKYKIYNQDVIEWAHEYQKGKFHALISDTPYHLTSIVKRFGKKNSAPAKHGTDGVFSRSSKGFMGQQWDGGDIAFRPETWEALGEHLYPGAFGMCFSASRNWHRLAVAIEDAGFIIHPTIFGWVQGQGFPKSTSIHKQIEKWYNGQDEQSSQSKAQYCVRCMQDTHLSPPLSVENSEGNVLRSRLQEQGVSSKSRKSKRIQVPKGKEESSMEGGYDVEARKGKLLRREVRQMSDGISTYGEVGWVHNGTPIDYGNVLGEIIEQNGSGSSYRPQSIKQLYKELDALCYQCRTQAIRELSEVWIGHRYGLQALKPAVEPIIVFQKPYEGRPLDNIIETGAGAINIDGGRIPTQENLGREIYQTQSWKNTSTAGVGSVSDEWKRGRWPANFLLSESVAQNLDAQTGIQKGGFVRNRTDGARPFENNGKDTGYHTDETISEPDGGASRFFYNVQEQIDEADPIYYCGKVSPKERNAGLDEYEEVERRTMGTGMVGVSGDRTSGKGTPIEMGVTKTRNPHPTLKPIALAKYLATLLLPPIEYAPRRILVPFSGVASEMIGCALAGWEHIVGIEFDTENGYVDLAHKRMEYWTK